MLVFLTFLGLESYLYKAHPGSSSILSDMPCGAADPFFDTLEPLLTLFLPLGTFSLYYHRYVGKHVSILQNMAQISWPPKLPPCLC